VVSSSLRCSTVTDAGSRSALQQEHRPEAANSENRSLQRDDDVITLSMRADHDNCRLR
jgi:hypothetical protein